jgi:hypothetical protein
MFGYEKIVLIRKIVDYNIMYTRLFILIFRIGIACVVTLYANALSTNSISNLKKSKGLVVIVRTNSSFTSAYDSHAQISCNKEDIKKFRHDK